MLEVHFDQRYLANQVSQTTSRETYWALAGIALFIIITACINFINLLPGLRTWLDIHVSIAELREPMVSGILSD